MSQAKQKQRGAADTAADDGRSDNLRDSPMMAHLLDALEAGTDVGHYGRLTFAMIARHFLDEDELVRRNARREHPVPPEVLTAQVRRFSPPYPGDAHRTWYIGASGTVEEEV